ncbi:MAG: hypothetical protein HYY50_05750 [Candidatus Kerfeldbacteria bacterium]|nr:hypothetical protein [Candidatus Kerfeldbacteria bacterium]
MLQLLQLLGGGLYLLNKIFLSVSERIRHRGRQTKARRWRVASWIVYLAGLGPIVAMFILKRNWIAASVEASGAPSMILGLVTALRTGEIKRAPRWLDVLALIFIVLGFTISIREFGGLTLLTQWLEVGLVTGFLIGTYQLAKEHKTGYLWFVLMHVSCGWLMWVEDLRLMFWQQVVSLGFIADAYMTTQRKRSLR